MPEEMTLTVWWSKSWWFVGKQKCAQNFEIGGWPNAVCADGVYKRNAKAPFKKGSIGVVIPNGRWKVGIVNSDHLSLGRIGRLCCQDCKQNSRNKMCEVVGGGKRLSLANSTLVSSKCKSIFGMAVHSCINTLGKRRWLLRYGRKGRMSLC